jgi:hypothetical protein
MVLIKLDGGGSQKVIEHGLFYDDHFGEIEDTAILKRLIESTKGSRLHLLLIV